jgi:hypothetical protein
MPLPASLGWHPSPTSGWMKRDFVASVEPLCMPQSQKRAAQNYERNFGSCSRAGASARCTYGALARYGKKVTTPRCIHGSVDGESCNFLPKLRSHPARVAFNEQDKHLIHSAHTVQASPGWMWLA